MICALHAASGWGTRFARSPLLVPRRFRDPREGCEGSCPPIEIRFPHPARHGPGARTFCHLLLWALLLLLGVVGCEADNPRDELARQLRLCDLAEDSGIIDSAVNACGAALGIVEEGGFPAKQVSELSYRLGRLERQRRNFVTAEELVLRSMAFAEETGDRSVMAARLVELSFSLAGQGRWPDGAEVLERALPLTDTLDEEQRRTAANAFRAFGLRLARMGRDRQAEQFLAQAEKLEEEAPEGAR